MGIDKSKVAQLNKGVSPNAAGAAQGRIRGTILSANTSVKAPHMGKIIAPNKLPAQPQIANPDSRTGKKRFEKGKKAGKLTLLQRRHDKRHKTPNKRKQWEVKCDCNPKKKFWVPEYYLKRRPNPKRDCGCSRRSNKMTNNKEYRIWYMMNTRTTNPDHVAYKHYGGRGIRVCQRWQWGPKGGVLDEHGKQIKDGFTCFLEDIGPRPSPEMTIDRKDNNKNYEPGNVKWATPKEQAGNRRTKEEVARDVAKFKRQQREAQKPTTQDTTRPLTPAEKQAQGQRNMELLEGSLDNYGDNFSGDDGIDEESLDADFDSTEDIDEGDIYDDGDDSNSDEEDDDDETS